MDGLEGTTCQSSQISNHHAGLVVEATRLVMGSETGADAASTVLVAGAVVNVRSAGGGSRRQLATVVRVHRNGDATVKYETTGETEKNVSIDRVQVVSDSDERSAFKVGERVVYLVSTNTTKKDQEADEKEDDTESWREGTVKLCRPDGMFDIVDVETGKVVRKLPAASVRAPSDKKSTKKSKESMDDKEKEKKQEKKVTGGSDKSDEDEALSAGALVEVKIKRSGEWQPATVQKARSDGTYDLTLDSDSDEVMKQVTRKLIRPRKPSESKKMKTAKSKKAEEDSEADDDDDGGDDDDDDEKSAIRKRKTAARKSRRKSASDNGDDDDEGDDTMSTSRRRLPVSRAMPTRFGQLRVNQTVEFDDKSGGVHRGHIKQLRSDDETCDVAHDSDGGETVSRRVPVANIRAVSALGRLFGAGGSPGLLQVNTRVYYRGKDGVERKGIILKVWKDGKRGDGGGPMYDVEDLADGEMFKKVQASRLRVVPWLDVSLPQWNTNFSAGFPSFMTGPVLRRGVKVRFRRKVGGRVVWVDGVIAKVKSDESCIVEFWGDTEDGKKERVVVKNRDIQSRFFQFSMPSASAALAGLSLPSIELLPRTTIKPGTAVEVAVAGGEKVMLGTVLSFNESSQTYAIQYRDGSKSKNVSRESVRVSLRRLRVGTEVEMVVEGPCKEVSTLDGEVAWVHRDEKVAVRINGGNNDVFAEVCPHALTVDGQPAFSAPLSSTWLELVGFRLNLLVEMFVYAWFAFGLMVELGDMITLARGLDPDKLADAQHMASLYTLNEVDWSQCAVSPLTLASNSSASSSSDDKYLVIPEEALSTDRAWLIALTIAKAVLTAFSVLLSGRRVLSKLSALADDYIDVKEFQQDQVLRRRLGIVSGLALLASFCSLLVYASLMGKFEHFCLFSATNVRAFDTLALEWMGRMFEIRSTTSDDIVQLALALSSKTTMNLFRALAFFLLLFAMPSSSTDFARRVLLLLPLAVALAAMVAAVAIAAVTAFYLVQRSHLVELGSDLMLSSDGNLAVVGVLVALWIDVAVFRLAAAAGRFYEAQMVRTWTLQADIGEDVLDQAERGEFGLQAKKEALITRVEQRQAQLGALKLTVLRVHRDWFAHMAVMVVGIAIDARLRQRVASLYVGGDEALEDMTLAALSVHLGFCCAWLVTVAFAALLAVALRRQGPPELLAFILVA